MSLLAVDPMTVLDQELFQSDLEIQTLLQELIEDSETNDDSSNSLTPTQHDVSNFAYLQPPEYYRKQSNQGRRRSTNPTYMPSLRIFRRDVRRRYGEMFVNVMNNHDPSLLSRFFQEYCRPGCHFYSTPPSQEAPRKVLQQALQKTNDEKYNLLEVVDGFNRNFELMPDSVFRLNNTQVRIKQGERGSVIVAKARILGTRLYAIEDMTKVQGLSVISSEESLEEEVSFDSSSSDDASSVTTMASSSDSSRDTTPSPTESSSNALELSSTSCFSENKEYWRRFRWTRLTTPMEAYMEAIFTMVLDESNHILRFHLDCQDYYEKPVAVSS